MDVLGDIKNPIKKQVYGQSYDSTITLDEINNGVDGREVTKNLRRSINGIDLN